MYYMLVACMAGPIDTGQNIITYLLLQLILIVLHLPHLGKDNRRDVHMATLGASLRCSSQAIQVFQETEDEIS
jgi:hypothetical protein